LTLSTHVLDTVLGRPAVGVPVTLLYKIDEGWRPVGSGVTDPQGRLTSLLAPGAEDLPAGIYRLHFDTGPYFRASGHRSFYPEVIVTFEVTEPATHHHVPLLLSPFGYSTYRGN